MNQERDIDEVCRGHARAESELQQLRDEVDRRHGIGGELIIARRERDGMRRALVDFMKATLALHRNPHDLSRLRQYHVAKTAAHAALGTDDENLL